MQLSKKPKPFVCENIFIGACSPATSHGAGYLARLPLPFMPWFYENQGFYFLSMIK